MSDFKDFLIKYRGAIIGGIISIVALILNLHKVLLTLALILFGILLGNYIQHNKELVKEKLKSYIDKM